MSLQEKIDSRQHDEIAGLRDPTGRMWMDDSPFYPESQIKKINIKKKKTQITPLH